MTQQQTEHDPVVHHTLGQTNVNKCMQSHVKTVILIKNIFCIALSSFCV